MSRLSALAGVRSDNPVLQRFSQFGPLASAEMALLRELTQATRHHPAQTELCREGRVQIPSMLLSGWACHQRILGDGRRQILRFLLPGDPIGSLSRPGLPAVNGTLTLTPVVVADARPLLRANDPDAGYGGLAEVFVRLSHADEVNLRNQVVRLGRQTAYERLVHLLLEFHHRLDVIGLVDRDSFSLPLTQEVLADALGLSVVHINRTLQQVRRDRLLEMRGGQVTLRQPDLMRAMADWAPLPGPSRS